LDFSLDLGLYYVYIQEMAAKDIGLAFSLGFYPGLFLD